MFVITLFSVQMMQFTCSVMFELSISGAPTCPFLLLSVNHYYCNS